MKDQCNMEPGKTEAERFLRQPQGTLPTNTVNVIKRINTLESKVTALENKQTIFIDHWTIQSADVLGNKRNNNDIIEEYNGSAWVVVTIVDGDIWFDSVDNTLSVYTEGVWMLIPLSSESVYINRADNISYVWTGSMMTPASSVLSYATEQEAREGIHTDKVISPFTLASATKELKTLTEIGGQLTGFANPLDVIVSYDGTNRTVTLTGDITAFWQGIPMSEKVIGWESGWTSEAHSAVDGSYFLYFNGTNFVWDTVAWDFKQLMIAMAYRDGSNFCLRECHGLMDWQSHQANHDNVGTYLKSGANITGVTLNSTVLANRRPVVSSAEVYDEDLPSILPALTDSLYSRLNLTGASVANITVDNADIISADATGRFNYDLFTTSWNTSIAANNDYGKIFLMAIPTTADTDCLKRRFIWIRPQQVSSSLATIQALTPSNLNLGQIGGALAEYVFVQEIIVRATSNNWQIVSTAKLTGNKRFQSSVGGSFLSSISTNPTLTGNGTAGSPLAIPYRTVALTTTEIDMTGNAAEVYTKTLGSNEQFSIINPIIGKSFQLRITGGTLNATPFTTHTATWILKALVTDYVSADTNILACQIRSAGVIHLFWTE